MGGDDDEEPAAARYLVFTKAIDQPQEAPYARPVWTRLAGRRDDRSLAA
jgi:hypothetical protein